MSLFTNVDLGYLDETDPKFLHSRWFPSKVGGKPAWLALKDLPTVEDLTCASCSNSTTFLAQIYAPDENLDTAFHRTIFIFICRTPGCEERSITVWRSQLPRKNDFYPFEPPNEDTDNFSIDAVLDLCQVCGCHGTKKCAKCHTTKYCSKSHQVVDWKSGHKMSCGKDHDSSSDLTILFSELEIRMESEEMIGQDGTTEEEQLEKFNKMVEEGQAGSLDFVDEKEFDSYAAGVDQDEIFEKFQERMKACPDQVIRYERHGSPLHISKQLPPEIPPCDYCKSPRTFEFQILPQILHQLKEEDIDFGTLMVYTCSKSCSEFESRENVSSDEAETKIKTYCKEYIFKQVIV